MRRRHAGIHALLLVCALAASAVGQQGQPPTKTTNLFYANATKDPLVPGAWVFQTPFLDNSVGLWMPNGPNLPAQTLDTTNGLLGYTLPSNSPWVFAFQVTELLYDDSPGEDFTNFGANFNAPIRMDPASNPTLYTGKYQFCHLPERTIWALLDGDPYDYNRWLSNGIGGYPSLFPTVTVLPFGTPGQLFYQVSQAMSVPPPATSPGGGALVGMNVVIQLGTVETNPMPPMPAKFFLSNCIGLQAMAGPAIKIGAGSGNHGPRSGVRTFKVKNPSISFKVETANNSGGRTLADTRILDGTTVEYIIPDNAVSGLLSGKSRTGPFSADIPGALIITHGPAWDLVAGQLPVFILRNTDGLPTFGTTVIANAGASGISFTLPEPPNGLAFDLELKIYPFSRTTDRAGFPVSALSDVPLSIAVVPEGALPIAIPVSDPPTSVGGGAIVFKKIYTNLRGDQTILIEEDNALVTGGIFDFLMVLRAYPTGTSTNTP